MNNSTHHDRPWGPTVLAIVAGFTILAAAVVGAAVLVADAEVGETAAADPTGASPVGDETPSGATGAPDGDNDASSAPPGSPRPTGGEAPSPPPAIGSASPEPPPTTQTTVPEPAPTTDPPPTTSPPTTEPRIDPLPAPQLWVFPEDGKHYQIATPTQTIRFQWSKPDGALFSWIQLEQCRDTCTDWGMSIGTAKNLVIDRDLPAGFGYRWQAVADYKPARGEEYVPNCPNNDLGACVVGSEWRTFTISNAVATT